MHISKPQTIYNVLILLELKPQDQVNEQVNPCPVNAFVYILNICHATLVLTLNNIL